MPVFKATPKKLISTEEMYQVDEPTEITVEYPAEEKETEQAFHHLPVSTQDLLAQLTEAASTTTDSFPDALLFAQAAVVAALSGGSGLPISHPIISLPIAPLGLSIHNLPFRETISERPQPRPKRKVTAPVVFDASPEIWRPSKRTSKATTPKDDADKGDKISTNGTNSLNNLGEGHKSTQSKYTPSHPEAALSPDHASPVVVLSPITDRDVQSFSGAAQNPDTIHWTDPEGIIGFIPLPVPESAAENRCLSTSKRRARELVPCTKCNKLMRRGSLREHLDMHTNNGRFPCSSCFKSFSRASALEKHLRTHTGEKPFKCDICPKAYRQKVHLNEHMRSHTGVRPYVCRLCGFTLASKSLLNRHLGTHGVKGKLNDALHLWYRSDAPKEEVLQLAAQAGLVVTDKQSSLSEQTNSSAMSDLATSGRKYLCTSCPAGFPTSQALRSHRILTHNVEFPHKCPECEEAFSSIKGRKTHLRHKHPKVCPICLELMPQRRLCYLEAHLREKHAGMPTPIASDPPQPSPSTDATGNEERTPDISSILATLQWKRFRADDPESDPDDPADTEVSDSEADSSEEETDLLDCGAGSSPASHNGLCIENKGIHTNNNEVTDCSLPNCQDKSSQHNEESGECDEGDSMNGLIFQLGNEEEDL